MKLRSKLGHGLLVLCLSLPAWAMNLNEAMSALSSAKASGQLGEQPDGYLGVVGAGGQAVEIAEQINQARRAEYQRLAKENGLQLGDVEAMAGQKALEKTPSGQYIQVNGKWVRK
ncbi:YdbL family protein [Pseudomonas sp. PDM16]|uniref:YdbL family protein n=1 Tax=Pseudomonas sp. PDM16 TaxID=2769292 RepID=UPI00177EB113|nr:YdbL family protein [Pseudomonas sp. PDM16]MBD9413693.1 YdbL family protein [Pseudomonas sp. PDM16]